jgi:hypothetical protein
MGDDAERTQPSHVLDDIGCRTSQRIWRLRKSDRHVVATASADLDSVEEQNPGAVRRRFGLACAVAVIGNDDELKTGAGGGRRDLVKRPAAI